MAPDFTQQSQPFPQQNGPPPGAIYGSPFVHPGYPYGVPMPHGYPPHMMPGPPGAYGPIHPGFPPPQHLPAPPQVQQQPPPQPQPQPQPQQPQQSPPVPPPVTAATANVEVKGQDPQSLDMSTTRVRFFCCSVLFVPLIIYFVGRRWQSPSAFTLSS
jgi:hypothetical protein